jgi:hypothetical protein
MVALSSNEAGVVARSNEAKASVYDGSTGFQVAAFFKDNGVKQCLVILNSTVTCHGALRHY